MGRGRYMAQFERNSKVRVGILGWTRHRPTSPPNHPEGTLSWVVGRGSGLLPTWNKTSRPPELFAQLTDTSRTDEVGGSEIDRGAQGHKAGQHHDAHGKADF